jgi:hypothetical protein
MGDVTRQKVEFGDFQTPLALARDVCALVVRKGFRPAAVLEPTCGTGAFLQAALETFPEVSCVRGFEINPEYVEQARRAVEQARRIDGVGVSARPSVAVHGADFFDTDWPMVLASLPEPILVLGNPPWVTQAELGSLGSRNLPARSNPDRLRGIDARTGKSNFDISEWMLRRLLDGLAGKQGMLAVLCKTTVARKVLLHGWQKLRTIASASIYLLDALRYFGAAVDAGLLVLECHPAGGLPECQVYDSLDGGRPLSRWGLRDGMLVSDLQGYERWRELRGTGSPGWRSGIKHDCRQVFELRRDRDRLLNGLGEVVDLEADRVFPWLKSSDLAARLPPRRAIVIPQRTLTEDPAVLRLQAPKTWKYLLDHAHLLDKRRSSIYRNRPRFSIFGVGTYSFAPWKVAIAGLYKKLDFVPVSPWNARPVLLDDTCYFFPCWSAEECRLLHDLLTSPPALEFLSALIFWDAKRPVTAQLLNLLDLVALARFVGKKEEVVRRIVQRQEACSRLLPSQPSLFDEGVTECSE